MHKLLLRIPVREIAISLTLLLPVIAFATGGTWTQQTGSGSLAWRAIAMSSDGTKILALDGGTTFNGNIYTSTDSGVTWVQRSAPGSKGWFAGASSADGTKLAAAPCCDSGFSPQYIYTSTDSGVTWNAQTGSGLRAWTFIVSSSDGSKLVAGEGVGTVYTSTDSGSSWTPRSPSGANGITAVASSADGTKLAAIDQGTFSLGCGCNSGGYIFTSTDSGATWTQQTSSGSRTWGGITSSADGAKLAATALTGYVYTSTDSGVTWTQQTGSGSRTWGGITSSSNGTNLAAVESSGYIYTSADSGVTWTQQTGAGSRSWGSIASTPSGQIIVAGDTAPGYIYTNTDCGGLGANCGVVTQGRIIRLVGHIRLRGGVRLAGKSPVKQCAGTSYGGYCWYFSPAHGSCTTACAAHNGCNLAGITAYGSSGTMTMCSNLLTALGAPTPNLGTSEGSGGGVGCYYIDYAPGTPGNYQYLRDTDTSTCSSDTSFLDSFLNETSYRACSCNN
jgi:hypothetical protein